MTESTCKYEYVPDDMGSAPMFLRVKEHTHCIGESACKEERYAQSGDNLEKAECTEGDSPSHQDIDEDFGFLYDFIVDREKDYACGRQSPFAREKHPA